MLYSLSLSLPFSVSISFSLSLCVVWGGLNAVAAIFLPVTDPRVCVFVCVCVSLPCTCRIAASTLPPTHQATHATTRSTHRPLHLHTSFKTLPHPAQRTTTQVHRQRELLLRLLPCPSPAPVQPANASRQSAFGPLSWADTTQTCGSAWCAAMRPRIISVHGASSCLKACNL